jgi:stage II sporulation protein AA (anti-sigma F factor antagonist)
VSCPTDRPAEHPTSGDPAAFACDVSRERDTASIRTVGELDLATVPILAGHVTQLRTAGCRHLTLDLSDLAFIDSSGLCFLLECHAESRQDGFTMALLPGPPAVQMMFELTATRDHLPFIDD